MNGIDIDIDIDIGIRIGNDIGIGIDIGIDIDIGVDIEMAQVNCTSESIPVRPIFFCCTRGNIIASVTLAINV